jgi:hypothetical protein
MSGRRFAVPDAALTLVSLALLGCGGSNGPEASTAAAGGLGSLTPKALAISVEGQTAGFLDREGTALHRSLEQFLCGKIATEVTRDSAECRPGDKTASISNPSEYPFACIVEGSADGTGLQVNITLGFVGIEVDGRCWRAANERISATTGAPALLTRKEAILPVNQISGCA